MNRKPIFDWFRKKLGRGFTQDEVDQLDDLLDGRVTPDAPSQPEQPGQPKRTGEAGIALMKRFEGFHKDIGGGKVEAYPDPGTGGEPWTIGWGSTGEDPFNGGRIKRGTVWTHAQANERYKQHLKHFEDEAARAIGNDPTSQPQFDALVSFAYNVGTSALRRSTLLRKHKAGDFAGAAAEFGRWSKAGGRVLKGLTRRRAAEADLYRSGF